MAKHTVDSLNKRLASLHGHYQRQYAGLPRHSRPVEPLVKLIEKAADIVRRVKKLKGEEARKLEATALERLKLYASEKDAIVEAQAASEAELEGRELAVRFQLTTGRYRRHFAGQDRRTRDLGLLRAITDDLRAIEGRLAELAAVERTMDMSGRHSAAKGQRDLCEGELKAIAEARRDQALEARADQLAAVANRQFTVYREQFEGRPRPTCRPELLERIVGTLEETLAELEDPAFGGLADPSRVEANRAVIRDQITRYRAELEALVEAHGAVSLDTRVGLLGGAANEMMALYREHFAGQDRATRNLSLLSLMCDRLGEVEQQMTGIGRSASSAANTRNVTLVRQTLRAWEEEYTKIAEVQAKRPGGTSAPRPSDPLAGLIRTGG